MKRLMTLLLAAGLVLGATSAAKAVDFKMTGLWQNRVSFADRNFEKHNGDDKMRAATRLRTQIDVIASESLKGVMFFEIGHQNWGKSAQGAAQTLGYGISGTWAVMARVKDISFMEDLSHVLRVVYYQGTNNKEMVRSKMISNPQDSVASMMYLTTGDKAVEVNFDTEYKLYKNLSLFVELGYIRLDLDKDLWKGVGYEAKENNFKGTFSVGYKF